VCGDLRRGEECGRKTVFADRFVVGILYESDDLDRRTRLSSDLVDLKRVLPHRSTILRQTASPILVPLNALPCNPVVGYREQNSMVVSAAVT
jgi:hypothetical protein